jgi:hypothetical protein
MKNRVCKVCSIPFNTESSHKTICSEQCKSISSRNRCKKYNELHADRRIAARKLKYVPKPRVKLSRDEKLIKRREYSRKNNNKVRAKDKTYRQNNRIKLMDSRMKKKYGISTIELSAMLECQDGKCYICKKEEQVTYPNGTPKRLSIDHCHTTGKVRKLLCTNCNTAIGQVRESVETLQSMIQYLQEHNKE